MKLNIKSRRGFTLIELLVVIGILAVLAAIAIPSVAGLIDRANKSADNTNANEMTNAIERFTSEYELVKQDISSGLFDETNLDSVQGRVFNTFNIGERRQITHLETDDGFNGYGLDNKSNYPVNEKTVKKIITNYMKTSSDTFLPKQSDHSYFYSPELGRVIVAPTGTSSPNLDKLAHSDTGVASSILPEGETIQWIDISLNERLIASGLPDTNENVALETDTYTTLRKDVLGYMEFASLSGGLFVPGTDTYIKINVKGEQVDATWLNLLQGEYIRVVNGELENGPKASQMHGELVVCKELSGIMAKDWRATNRFLTNSNVSSVILEEGITKIGSWAFSDSQIEKISIPSTVTYIGSGIFNGDRKLKEIIVSEDNKHFTVIDNVLFTKDMKTLIRYPSGDSRTEYTIPNSVIETKSFAFSHCQNLQTLRFGENLVKTNAQMMDGSYKMRDVYINDACVLTADNINFRHCGKIIFHINATNKNVKCIDNVLYTYNMKQIVAIGYQADGTVEIPDTITELTSVYSACNNLILPTTIKSVRVFAITHDIGTIYYKGSESDFANIRVNVGNEESGSDVNLKLWNKAQKVYNYN